MEADRKVLQTQLEVHKCHDMAAGKSLRRKPITVSEYEVAREKFENGSQELAQRLVRMTSVKYVEMLWMTLGRTAYHERIYGLIGKALQQSLLKHRPLRAQGGSKVTRKIEIIIKWKTR